MAKIVYSPLSVLDLEEIGNYISDILVNPVTAFDTLEFIQNKIDKLADTTFIGALLSSFPHCYGVATGEYRVLVCKNYLVFCQVNDKMVYIDRILYSRRDYVAILFGKQSES